MPSLAEFSVEDSEISHSTHSSDIGGIERVLVVFFVYHGIFGVKDRVVVSR